MNVLIYFLFSRFGVAELLSLLDLRTDSCVNNSNEPLRPENLKLETFLVQMCFIAALRIHWGELIYGYCCPGKALSLSQSSIA